MHANRTLWLTVVNDANRICLLEYNRLQALATMFASTEPALIVLIGADAKYKALKPILTRHQGRPGVHLHYHDLCGMAGPVLFADCGLLDVDLTPQTSTHYHPNLYVPHTRRPLLWLEGGDDGPRSQDQVRRLLCGSLLGPFTDVICIFAADVGGPSGVVRLLSHWRDLRGVGLWFPEVIVIWEPPPLTSLDPVSHAVEMQLLYEMIYAKVGPQPLDLEVVVVSDTNIMGQILACYQKARRRRGRRRTLYSFTHTVALFQKACDHAVKTIKDPFNPIIASRYQNPVPPTLADCLTTFLRVFSPQQFTHTIQLIASGIAFNAMPPGMHAIRGAGVISPVTLLEDIRSLALYEMDSLHNHQRGSADYHLEALKKGWGPCTRILCDTVCLSCIARIPDRRLPCQHSFCEVCLEVFGEHCKDQEYTFYISRCMVCLASFDGVKVHIQPPTAGARILAVDGGGVRGVVALTSLMQLEAAISRIVGMELPIQEHFDLAVGTSSGWSVVECLRQFIRLANKAFRRRPRLKCLPILSCAIDYMLSFMADSQYSADTMEGALKEAFGPERDMFSTDNHRTKIAVTATMTNSLPCIFTNYNNGSGTVHIGSTLHLAGLGTFQDGGLWENNPTSAALWESSHIWPNSSEPDLVLSLGTGSTLYTPHSTGQCPVGPLEPRGDGSLVRGGGFLSRAYRSYMYLLDGEPAWQKLLGGLPLRRRARFYRLNVQIPGKEPGIDDTAEIPQLCMTRPSNLALNAAAWAIIASLFYFELERPPVYGPWGYVCEGRILCRLGVVSQGLILEGLERQQARFVRCGEPLTGEYGRTAHFTVVDLQVEVSIDLYVHHEGSRPIGGSPFTVHELMQRQHLDRPFGTANHLKRHPAISATAPPMKRRHV
ncbi:unnamed protein product [Tuber aestivum]|uniref:PNPLA domain-containing protein n=1 Tax=Tuber aestivum TaxID=59557 RepID=A0A292PKF4_9PEZI|nr:unnamed protein product [Tuber aestivum]